MNIVCTGLKSNFNNFNKAKLFNPSQKTDANSASDSFISFKGTSSENNDDIVLKSTFWGAAVGVGCSLFGILNENLHLNDFGKYKKRAVELAKKCGDDVSKLTDDALRQEIVEIKNLRKFMIPASFIFWTGLGVAIGSSIGSVVSVFEKEF